MSANLRKFANDRFIKTIDLGLMLRLFERYADTKSQAVAAILRGPAAAAREELSDLLKRSEDGYPEGLRGDLHRLAELGSRTGLQMIIEEAHRRRVDLFPELKVGDRKEANPRHDPKHIALRTFLDHQGIFYAASDQMVLRCRDRFAGFMGTTGNVAVDLTDEMKETLRSAIGALFKEGYQSDYCRLGAYYDAGELNIVVTHGSVVSTLPVLEGETERVICIRSVSQALLRYSEITGLLRLGSFKLSLRQQVADLFATIVLERPDFFGSAAAQDLYTLKAVERDGALFSFENGWDPRIDKVVILGATALRHGTGRGKGRPPRSITSTDPEGDALEHLLATPVCFDGSWRLSELQFRVFFKTANGAKQQVTVTLRPPRVLQYRSAEHEQRILDLIARNGLTNDRDPFPLATAAE